MTTHINLEQLPSVPMPTLPLSVEVEYKAKLSYPDVPSPSLEGAVGQDIVSPVYSTEQHETWKKLMEKRNALTDKQNDLCHEYMEGMRVLDFPLDRIPSLAEISEKLKRSTGWQVMRVSGLVDPIKFFALLANKIFPCTDFIRHGDELDYTPAPDLFHDQVGHLPMLTHTRFAKFFQLFGLAGCSAKTEEHFNWFNRIYWFTTEFGLMRAKGSNTTQIYGAGIASSCGEMQFSLSEKVKRLPFDLSLVCETNFDIHHMQDLYYEIESFDDLEEKFLKWAQINQFLSF